MSIAAEMGRNIAIVALAAAVGLGAGWMARGTGIAAKADEDATTLAERQVKRFFEATSGRVPLADVLGDAFQLMRTDGSRYDRDGYLARPSSLQSYVLKDFRGIQSGNILTATFFAGIKGKVEGMDRDSAEQPRLAVFALADGEWRLQAFANLGQGLTGDVSGLGEKAIDAWMGALVKGDKAGIGAILAPEFEIIRSDGSAYGKAEYLEKGLPKIAEQPKVDRLAVTGYGDYLVARYWLTLNETIDGVKSIAHAPRLTVFRKSGETWLVVAHANFARVDE